MKVCEKVQRKGTTSYNEVADELVAEFSAADNHILPNESVSVIGTVVGGGAGAAECISTPQPTLFLFETTSNIQRSSENSTEEFFWVHLCI